jgi:hypothetical protein
MAFLIDHYMVLRAPRTLYPNKNKKEKKINLKIIPKMEYFEDLRNRKEKDYEKYRLNYYWYIFI